MMVTERQFLVVPLISLLCNAFLFLTFLTARKNRLITAFLLLLFSFTLWTGGSLLMRLEIFPGMHFWYQVSVTGIFLVPFCLYNFMVHFTGRRAPFTLAVLGVLWLAVIALNLADVFIQHPQIVTEDGSKSFVYVMTPWVALPLTFAALTLFMAGRLAVESIRRGDVPLSVFLPVFLGAGVMFLGNLCDLVPGLASMSVDTLACGINAALMYYALYKKRMITLDHVTSSSPIYLVSAVFALVMLLAFYAPLEAFYDSRFADFAQYKTLVVAVLFSLATVAVYNLIKRLMDNLFVKGQQALKEDLREFSRSISRTLEMEEVLSLYREFLSRDAHTGAAYVLLLNEEERLFELAAATRPMLTEPLSLPGDHPLVKYLVQQGQGVSYRDFRRTGFHRSLWEEEKRTLQGLNAALILPILCDGRLMGMTLLSQKEKDKPYTVSETSYQESAAAILSIAVKNALLYRKMRDEARRDPLTGLYNRRYFMERIERDFEKARAHSLVAAVVNLDDFRLYNELYGTAQGDALLIAFGRILLTVVGDRGVVCRNGGKEFLLELPFADARQAMDCIDQARQALKRHLKGLGRENWRYLTFSAGVCMYPTAASTLKETLTYANMAVYTAKKNGKNRTVVYANGQAVSEQEKNAFELGENCAATIYALTAAIDAKDHYTFSHSNNVALYASQLARAIGLNAEHVEIIRQAGLLHDIGKIGIPEAILCKTSRLTDEEYEVIKGHVEGSIAMIRHLPSLDYVIPAAIGHHERWDGRGYPRGIAGEDIPLGARCLCLADCFDAMTSRRSYKEAFPVDKAVEEIRRNLGTQFDPQLGLTFIDLVERGVIRVQEAQ